MKSYEIFVSLFIYDNTLHNFLFNDKHTLSAEFYITYIPRYLSDTLFSNPILYSKFK